MRRKHLLGWGVVLACAICAADAAAADVYGDAVFWFRGGRDANGDGILNVSNSNRELFNELKAANTNDATQSCIVRGKPDGIVFETEPVVFPCQPNVTQDLQCIRFKQELEFVDNGDGTITTNGWPNQLDVPVGNLITGEQYSCVIRFRRDGGYVPNRTEDLLALGYNSPIGWLLRISGTDDGTGNSRYLDVYVKEGASWEHARANLAVDTNEWTDVAVSVSKLENGRGNVRIALARPRRAVVFNKFTTPAAQSFCSYTNKNARAHWRLGAQADSPTRAYEWNTLTTGGYMYSSYVFRGSVQQLAYWDRALSDDEIYEAFGMPRPNLMQVGVGNGGSDEFGAERTGSSQTIDAAVQTLRDRTSDMLAGDELTVTFKVNAQEAGMAQLLTFASTTNSPACMMRATVNGTALGSKAVSAAGSVTWFVPASVTVSGENTVVLRRVDAGSGKVQIDMLKLGGSWQAGLVNGSNVELIGEQKMGAPFFSSADMGWKHWVSPLTTYHGGLTSLECTASNQVYHIWVDDVAARFCPATFKTSLNRIDRGAPSGTVGDEYIDVFVNGTLKRNIPLSETPKSTYVPFTFSFEPGELKPGWNEIRFAASPTKTCYWYRDYFRFELGKMALGTVLILR